MPSFNLFYELNVLVTQSSMVASGTVHLLRCFPPTTAIQLYEFLKNDSRSCDRTDQRTLQCADLFDGPGVLGGGERDRTDDPLLAKQVLSQLSYTPRGDTTSRVGGSGWIRTNDPRLIKTVL